MTNPLLLMAEKNKHSALSVHVQIYIHNPTQYSISTSVLTVNLEASGFD